MRILILQDDRSLGRDIEITLKDAGFAVDIAFDSEKCHSFGMFEPYDAAVLDIDRSEGGRFDIVRNWRAAGRSFPVILLSENTGWQERIAGLNAGADDYLEKPFMHEELVVRLRTIMRRTVGLMDPTLRFSDIELDPVAQTVKKSNKIVDLTAIEMRILSYLMHRPGRIISHNEFLDHIYSCDDTRSPNTIEVHIAKLRRKLGNQAIRTIRGMGYRMNETQ